MVLKETLAYCAPMRSLNIKVSVMGIISSSLLLIVVLSLSGLSIVMPIAAGSLPIEDDTTTDSSSDSAAPTTTLTPTSENTSSIASSPATITTNTTTTTPRVELEDEPFAVGRYFIVSKKRKSDSQVQFTFEGNTTITLPNSTETIMTRDTGQGNITHLPGGVGNIVTLQIHITSKDGSESGIFNTYEIFESEPDTGIGVAHFSINSTSVMLEPLGNTIAVLLHEVVVPEGIPPEEFPGEDFIVYFFEWEGGGEEEGSIGSETITTSTTGLNNTLQ